MKAILPGAASGAPRATIVVTARERYGFTERSIESIVRNTGCAYRLIFADAEAPEALRRRLVARAGEWKLELVDVKGAQWPNELRRHVVPDLESDYVVFIDNDVIVEPGWLEAMIDCADATGAGVVGPLYLAGDGIAPSRVHMAGGDLVRTETTTGTVLVDAHRHLQEDPERVAATEVRRPCDFVEFHCLMVRTDLARHPSILDPAIACVHEHIDLSLAAKALGYATFSEPAARVTYLGMADWTCADLPFRRRRWAYAAGDASIAAFCDKWQIANDERSFGAVREFLHLHGRNVDPIRPEILASSMVLRPMALQEVPQSRSALIDLALARDYDAREVRFLGQAYQLATTLMDGGYRPCGRPFILHLAGTAGVLLHYGFKIEIVAAGLLHAAYTHSPQLTTGPQSSVDAVCTALGGRDSSLESRVRAYTRRGMDLAAFGHAEAAGRDVPIADAEILAMAAANEIDMLVSGEFRYSGRSDALPPAVVALIGRVSALLGVPGLAETLRLAVAAQSPVAPELLTGMQGSYRIAGYNLVPMTNPAFFQVEGG